MPLYKISGDKADKVKEINFADAKIDESELEDWVASKVELLGEPLLIFGRQVPIPGLGDTIDLLALDKNGALVVIELKRADLRAPVDIQGIRYASYVTGWSIDDLEDIAAGYFEEDESDNVLQSRFQEFAEAEGGDEDSVLNQSQRVILVGQKVRDRLGSVALWLRNQGVDITLVEIHPFQDGREIYLEPITIIPPLTTEEWEAVGTPKSHLKRPWIGKGAEWHKKQGGEKSFERTQALIKKIQEAKLVDAVSYDQKHYIALRKRKRNWISIKARPTGLRIDVRCSPGDFNIEKLAKRLGLSIFSGEKDFKEKIALPSSVATYQRNTYYCIRLRLKDDFDVLNQELVKFFIEASKKFK